MGRAPTSFVARIPTLPAIDQSPRDQRIVPFRLRSVERHVRGSGSEDPDPSRGLTPREREVLQLIAEGHHTKRIAERLGISPKTVLNHRENLMKKVGTRSLASLIRYALQEGFSEL